MMRFKILITVVAIGVLALRAVTPLHTSAQQFEGEGQFGVLHGIVKSIKPGIDPKNIQIEVYQIDPQSSTRSLNERTIEFQLDKTQAKWLSTNNIYEKQSVVIGYVAKNGQKYVNYLVPAGGIAPPRTSILLTNPPGKRVVSTKGGWFVQALSLENSGNNRTIHVSFGVANKSCAGRGPHDGPYLDVQLLDSQGNVLVELAHIAELMVPDSATIGKLDIDVTSKVSEAYVDKAAALGATMRADGKC